MTKRKKPLTCKICGKKFSFTAKAHPLGRLSKHIAKDHPKQHRQRINKAKKTKGKGESQLDKELQFTDDMILQSLMNAGIPIVAPQQQPMLNPYTPTQHQSLAGILITAYKLGQAGYTAYKGTKAVVKAVKKAKSK